MRRHLLTLAASLVAVAACHAPRSPREVADGSVSGRWTAESAAVGEPFDSGHVAWRLALEQREAGKLAGRGYRVQGGDSTEFTLTGLRGENKLNVQLHLPDHSVRYRGSVADPKTIVGEMHLPGTTLPVTFTRQ